MSITHFLLKQCRRKALLPITLALIVFATRTVSTQESRSTQLEKKDTRGSLTFDAVSIRPSKPGGQPSARVLPDGYIASDQNIWTLIMTAYFPRSSQYWSNDRLVGAPSWAISEPYDLQGKAAPAEVAAWRSQGSQVEMLRSMLQAFLAERCKLVLHHTARVTPIYALVVSKHGSKLQETKAGEKLPSGASLPGGGIFIPSSGELKFFNTPMSSLVVFLSRSSPRPIEDQTGLKGKYDFVLPRRDESNSSTTDPDPASSYRVEDLGLVLKSAKAQEDTLVIDHIEKPSPN